MAGGGVKKTGKKLFHGKPGPGRPKGRQNNNTRLIKDMILKALDEAGGVEYLAQQAQKNPGAFMTLVGKVLPLQLTGENGGAIQHEVIRRIVDHRSAG